MLHFDVEIAHIRCLGEGEHNVHRDLKAEIDQKQYMKLHVGESLETNAKLFSRF